MELLNVRVDVIDSDVGVIENNDHVIEGNHRRFWF